MNARGLETIALDAVTVVVALACTIVVLARGRRRALLPGAGLAVITLGLLSDLLVTCFETPIMQIAATLSGEGGLSDDDIALPGELYDASSVVVLAGWILVVAGFVRLLRARR